MALYVSQKLKCYKWLCHAISLPNLTNAITLPIPMKNEDWQEIIYLGSVHGVLPRLFEALRDQHRLEFLPADASEALEGFYELNCLFNHRLREQIITVTRLLNVHDIYPVWLKGATNLLAADWKLSSRTMLDLDLWIPDKKDQLRALEILGKDGYFIQPESVGRDYSLCQHYAPIIKTDLPARLEIHRHVVSPACASLLTDESALNTAIWINSDVLSFGTLSLDNQIMQSYLQCTEQAADSLNPRGTTGLMKMVDFLERVNSKNLLDKWFSQHPELFQNPWKLKMRKFCSHLRGYFFVNTPIPLDKDYHQRISFALNFPKLEIICHIISHGFHLLLRGKLGTINTWPGKLQRQLLFQKKSRP